jgi:starch synthase (maltosyl-transferring)
VRQRPPAVKKPPLVYNLFPRYFPSMDEWGGAVAHAADMGFTWIYVNPFHETGFSGSQYAVRDYYRIDKLFLKSGQAPSDFRPLSKFIDLCSKNGLKVMMDLVINHTAFDSVLVDEKPSWFKRNEKGEIVHPFALNPADPGNITIWGDLAEIDNMTGNERESLWAYWDKLIGFFQDLGVQGYRCDAAYQVPGQLWKFLISTARRRDPETVFLAETLGCTLEQIEALHGTGFDYLYNSSKYWEFDQPWCIEQHAHNKKVAPSVSFPESHDTPRLAGEFPGTLAVQKSRFFFCAVFSEGLLMTMGYEYGAKIRMDVVRGSIKDVEQPQWDLTKWIAGINRLKLQLPVLSEEGSWKALSSYDRDILFLEKSSDEGSDPVMLCINKNKLNSRTVSGEELPGQFGVTKFTRLFSETSFDAPEMPEVSVPFELGPAEIVLLFK